MENVFLSKSSGSDVWLEKIQDTTQDIQVRDKLSISVMDVGASGSQTEPCHKSCEIHHQVCGGSSEFCLGGWSSQEWADST